MIGSCGRLRLACRQTPANLIKDPRIVRGSFSLRLLQILLSCLLFSATSIGAQVNYPDYREIYVNDFANLLPDEIESDIRSRLKELRDKRDIEFTVITIRSMRDYGHDGPIEPFATGLFNDWGVGNADRNDGVMMLIARNDRHMRIEVGAGYGMNKNLAMKEIIEGDILPYFREDNYAEGISVGVDSVIHDLTGYWPGEYDASRAERAFSAFQRFLDWIGNWIYAILAPFLLVPVRLYFRWKRNKPRYCLRDGKKMVRLDEDADDARLVPGQIMEETLKSVDYDVWKCPTCDHIKIEAYRAWFSSYGACPSCSFRTVEGDTTVIRSATKSSEGLKRIDYHCLHCGHEYSEERTIPRVTESSSSSSSFGGGSSSGGGASGSW